MTTDDLIERARLRRGLPSPEVRRMIRVHAGLTQAEVAEALAVTPSAVWRWEAGDRHPTGSRLDGYAALLERLRREVGA